MKLIAELYTVIQFHHLPLPQGIFNNRWTRSRACATPSSSPPSLWAREASRPHTNPTEVSATDKMSDPSLVTLARPFPN